MKILHNQLVLLADNEQELHQINEASRITPALLSLLVKLEEGMYYQDDLDIMECYQSALGELKSLSPYIIKVTDDSGKEVLTCRVISPEIANTLYRRMADDMTSNWLAYLIKDGQTLAVKSVNTATALSTYSMYKDSGLYIKYAGKKKL